MTHIWLRLAALSPSRAPGGSSPLAPAAEAARAARRRRIRDESRAVAEHLARDPEAGASCEDRGEAGGEVGQAVSRHPAGTVVLVDRRDALPEEANKRRPAVVVEDADLFDSAWPNVVLVPLTSDQRLAIPTLSVRIEPPPANGLDRPS